MKFVLLLPLMFLSPSLFAETLRCQWQDNPKYQENYFRPAQFDLILDSHRARIAEDTYFDRYYEPCWTGNWESCRFSFGHDAEKNWEVEAPTDTQVILHQDYLWFYARLEFTFSRPLTRLSQGDQVKAVLNGDDGDGTFIRQEQFLCFVKKAH